MKSFFTILFLSLFATQLFAQEMPCLPIYHSDSAFIATALRHESVIQLDGISSISMARKGPQSRIAIALKNGSSVQINIRQQCATGNLEASLEQNFACKRNIDCMPSNDRDQQKYCGPEYLAWAKQNCGFEPEVLF